MLGFPEKISHDESEDSSGQEEEDISNLVRQQNRKKKKSGGFQSMGRHAYVCMYAYAVANVCICN